MKDTYSIAIEELEELEELRFSLDWLSIDSEEARRTINI